MSLGPWGVGRSSNSPVVTIPKTFSVTDVYTATATKPALLAPSAKQFALQIKGIGGTPTLWTVVLEGSLDGINFSIILTSTQAVGDGQTIWNTTPSPILYFRSRCSVLTLAPASSMNVFILGIA